MKKTVCFLLSLLLFLSLTACGADEKYAGLLDSLETGDYADVKSELSTLSPDFKAEADRYAKYEDLIDLLEEGNYEDALIDVERRIPVPETEIIEITMENWETYFEIVPDYYWDENAFGEGESLTVGFSLFLKDAYASRLVESDNTSIACTASFDAREKTLDVNWKEKTFAEVPYTRLIQGWSWSGLDEGRFLDKSFEEACKLTEELDTYDLVPQDDNILSNLFWLNHFCEEGETLYNFYYCENISMVRIFGTLELLAEQSK